MRKFPLICFAAICAGNATCGHADDEVFSFQQAGDGIRVTLSGILIFCNYELGGFVGEPSWSATGNAFAVASNIEEGECNPPPVIPPPVPFAFTVNLGALPDGTYPVSWTYIDVSPTPFLPPRRFDASFVVESGELAIFRNGFDETP